MTAAAVLKLQKGRLHAGANRGPGRVLDAQLNLSELVTKADLRAEMAQMWTELQALEHRMTLRLGGHRGGGCRDRGGAGEAVVTDPAYYEVELRGLTYEDDGNGVLKITGSSWKPVKVFKEDAIPTPLTIDTLDAARAHAGRDRPGSVRIVRVTDEGEVIEPAEMGDVR
jgi:hypothetical protein